MNKPRIIPIKSRERKFHTKSGVVLTITKYVGCAREQQEENTSWNIVYSGKKPMVSSRNKNNWQTFINFVSGSSLRDVFKQLRMRLAVEINPKIAKVNRRLRPEPNVIYFDDANTIDKSVLETLSKKMSSAIDNGIFKALLP